MKERFSAVVKPQKAVHPSTVIAMQLIEAIREVERSPDTRHHFAELVTEKIHPLLIEPPAVDTADWTEIVERLRVFYVCAAPGLFNPYSRDYRLSELEQQCLDYCVRILIRLNMNRDYTYCRGPV